MKLLRGFNHTPAFEAGTVATIGNFDGVHRGHQALLSKLRLMATAMQRPLVVILFEPQPAEYFHGGKAPSRLFSLREKLNILRQCGVDYVCCLKFDEHMAKMTAVDFAERYIFSMLKANYLLIGEDFRFGYDRCGDVALLSELGHQHACVVKQFSEFYIDNQRVSSTTIRKALQRGELDYAAKLLGRTYTLCGRVIHGDGRGRQFGFPTANLHVHPQMLPLNGVFCVQVRRKNGASWLTGVANMGCRPTVDGRKRVLEIHLFDVDESLYGELLQVRFVHKLRDEVKFPSVDALIAQIHNDVTAAGLYFTQFKRVETNGRL